MNHRMPNAVMLMTQDLGPAGGTERQLVEIARSLDRSKFSPHVLCFNDGVRGDELRAAKVPVFQIPLRSFLSPATLIQGGRLARYLHTHRVRIAHTFDYPLTCFGVPIARMAATPIVLSSQRGHRCLTPPRYRPIQRLTDRLVDGIVTNCEAVRRHLIDDERVPPGQIRTCYNGIDIGKFAPLAKTNGSNRTLVIGVVAMLRREKNLETLLSAFSTIRTLRPNLRLVIVGSGVMLPRLESLATSLQIREITHFEPATTDVVTWLRSIDIFVLPSLTEALSNSLMEAMACGCAVVASNVGGNPELIHDGQNGLIFEPQNVDALACRLRLLIENDVLRNRIAEAGARTIRERFSLERSAHCMEQIYEEYLASAA